jgi:hypothetical protein
MTSNGKTLNCKIVDLLESYNFHMKFSSIRISIIWLWRYFKWKNFELRSCRSVESYNFHIKFTSIRVQTKNYKFLKRDWTLPLWPTTVGRRYNTTRLLPPWGTTVGPRHHPHGVRCIILQIFSGPYIFAKKRKKSVKKKNFQLWWAELVTILFVRSRRPILQPRIFADTWLAYQTKFSDGPLPCLLCLRCCWILWQPI